MKIKIKEKVQKEEIVEKEVELPDGSYFDNVESSDSYSLADIYILHKNIFLHIAFKKTGDMGIYSYRKDSVMAETFEYIYNNLLHKYFEMPPSLNYDKIKEVVTAVKKYYDIPKVEEKNFSLNPYDVESSAKRINDYIKRLTDAPNFSSLRYLWESNIWATDMAQDEEEKESGFKIDWGESSKRAKSVSDYLDRLAGVEKFAPSFGVTGWGVNTYAKEMQKNEAEEVDDDGEEKIENLEECKSCPDNDACTYRFDKCFEMRLGIHLGKNECKKCQHQGECNAYSVLKYCE